MANKGGRPKKVINQAQFEAMCGIQCTEKEICDVLDVTDKTLTRWCKETYKLSFSEIYKKKSASGKMSLRRMQFKLAERNASMAIFLGKQYLGQRDIVENTNDDQMQKVNDLLSKIKDEANDNKQ